MTQQRLKLPRKKKKFLKKGIWLYEADENGNSLSASPYNNEKDYLAFKEGRLRKLFRRNKNQRREIRKNLDKEITVTDEILYSYVNEIF